MAWRSVARRAYPTLVASQPLGRFLAALRGFVGGCFAGRLVSVLDSTADSGRGSSSSASISSTVGNADLKARWQGAGQLVARHADGLVDAGERVLGQHAVLALAEYQADGRLIGRVTERVVDDVAVEVELAGVFRPEGPCLQVDDNECTQFQMVEEKVDVKIRVVDLDPVLPADEGEPWPSSSRNFSR